MKHLIFFVIQFYLIFESFQKKRNQQYRVVNYYDIANSMTHKYLVSKDVNLNNYNQSDVLTNMLPLENRRNNGRHSYSQIQKLLFNRGLTHGQIKAIIAQIDQKKEGGITDENWDIYFQIYIAPFQECDTNKNNYLDLQELTICLQNAKYFQYLNQLTQKQIQKVMFVIDQPDQINIFNYIWLRKVNSAAKNCGTNYLFQPDKLYCALGITSPRTRRLYNPDEKLMFLSGIILSDGYYNGQQQFLDVVQFIGMAYIYNFFNDFELPFDDGFIYKEDLLKAVQEQMLPFEFTPSVVQAFYEDMPYLNFLGLAMNVYSFRLYTAASITDQQGWSIFTKQGFQQLITQVFPQRIQFAANQCQVPSQEEIETVSQDFWNIKQLSTDSLDYQLNNIVFLEKSENIKNQFFQKSLNVKLHKHKNIPLQIYELAATMNFTNGADLVYNIINTYNNETISLVDFQKFYRISLFYLEYDPNALQRITIEQIKQKGISFVKQTLNINEKKTWDQLQDYLQSRPDFYMNYKQFLSFFFIQRVFEFMRIQGTQQVLPATRLLIGFQKLGMRLSKYAVRTSAKSFDYQSNQRNFNYQQLFNIALTEEIMAMRRRYIGLLNTSTNP